MPEIRIKHVVSFSSEDKIHKAENILKPETYRKWKCATTGEKKATIALQFEKATKIHSIDIGNERSAFVEVLVGRSSDSSNDYQVLLVASSFMSPLESRNETHTNRVRMFGPDKLSHNVKDEKWDCVQIVCTQPFNKNISYGLTFVKFHSPPEVIAEVTNEAKVNNATTMKLGAFNLKTEDDDDSSPSVGMWFSKRKEKVDEQSATPASIREASSYAAAILASPISSVSKVSPVQGSGSKRKSTFSEKDSYEPPTKKESYEPPIKKESYEPPTKKESTISQPSKLRVPYTDIMGPKVDQTTDKKPLGFFKKLSTSAHKESDKKEESKTPYKTMGKVVFVLSGFVNPLRSQLRDKAIEMGAKYKTDWDSSCTHLICAFLDTPKYNQVYNKDGRIVNKDWIIDCYRKQRLLPWRKYMLGKYSKKSSSDETGSDEEVEVARKEVRVAKKEVEVARKEVKVVKKEVMKESSSDETPSDLEVELEKSKTELQSPKFNGNSRPKVEPIENTNSDSVVNDEVESETDDEDAIKDYLADTESDTDSGGDTEDEIRKVEKKTLINSVKNSPKKDNFSNVLVKPSTKDLPLPDLPNLFKSRHFYLYGDFSTKVYHNLQRYITAYNGIIEDYMSDSIKYVITESKWDKNFDDALSENEDLIFVRPQWIYKCHDSRKLVPYQPFIIIPDT